MKTLEKISDFFGKYMAIITIVCAVAALLAPAPVHAALPTSIVTPLLGIVMFGMGMTLTLHDFKVVFTKPKAVICGILAQFVIMPCLAYLLCVIFQLPPELAVGVILVGTCPGGTSSNVISYLCKGDVALSVGCTSCTTLLAPIVTPWLTFLLAGQTVDVSVWNMFVSILQVVVVPIALGIVFNRLVHRVAVNIARVLPVISIVAIALIVMAVVSANAANILSATGLLVLGVVILHNCCGYALGLGIGKLLGLSSPQASAISVEVGMQNSGLATSLATLHFAQYPMAAVPGAVFSVWHNVSGAIYANILARTLNKNELSYIERVARGEE